MLPPGGAGRNFYGVRPEVGPFRRAGGEERGGNGFNACEIRSAFGRLLKFA